MAFLAHEECPTTGEVYSAAGGRIARFFIGLTQGYYNPELTIEDVGSHFEEIRNEEGYSVPTSNSDEVRLLLQQLSVGSRRTCGQDARQLLGATPSEFDGPFSLPANPKVFDSSVPLCQDSKLCTRRAPQASPPCPTGSARMGKPSAAGSTSSALRTKNFSRSSGDRPSRRRTKLRLRTDLPPGGDSLTNKRECPPLLDNGRRSHRPALEEAA